MNREDEIFEAARNYCHDNGKDSQKHRKFGFVAGAKWADEHWYEEKTQALDLAKGIMQSLLKDECACCEPMAWVRVRADMWLDYCSTGPEPVEK